MPACSSPLFSVGVLWWVVVGSWDGHSGHRLCSLLHVRHVEKHGSGGYRWCWWLLHIRLPWMTAPGRRDRGRWLWACSRCCACSWGRCGCPATMRQSSQRHLSITQVLNQPPTGMLLWAVGQHLRAVVSFAYTTARQCALSCGCLIKYSSTARKCALACGCLMNIDETTARKCPLSCGCICKWDNRPQVLPNRPQHHACGRLV